MPKSLKKIHLCNLLVASFPLFAWKQDAQDGQIMKFWAVSKSFSVPTLAKMHSKWAKENADIILPLWNFFYLEGVGNAETHLWNRHNNIREVQVSFQFHFSWAEKLEGHILNPNLQNLWTQKISIPMVPQRADKILSLYMC